MKTFNRVMCWCVAGAVLGFALTRETPRAVPNLPAQSDKTLGITPALHLQSEGAVIVDLRPKSPQNLPVSDARFSVNPADKNLIIIGDENAVKTIKNPQRIVGIVPPWTLPRETNLPRDWEISSAQLARQATSYQIVDVREADEWARSHVPRSRQVSMFEIEDVLSKSRPVAVFCLTGHRSAFVVRRLRERGFKNVLSVRGGWLDWRAQNRELVAE